MPEFDEQGRELESVECASCAGLSALRETCEHCGHTGRVLRPIRPGHQTLSDIRRRMGQENTGRYGDDPMSPRTGPVYDDPMWVGTERP